MKKIKFSINVLALSLIGLASTSVMAKATFVINIQDDPDEGFNDPTPVTPVGGNNGTTLGEQRLNVFRRAGQIWGANINSDIEIVINAQFDPQTCSNQGAVLGSAGPTQIYANFANVPITNTWYYPALADSISGQNLGGVNDVNTIFNSEIDNGCLGGSSWYYGLDGSTAPNSTALLPVVLHELGHGLGSSTVTSGTTGAFISGRPDIWTNFLYDLSTKSTWREMSTNALRVASAINEFGLVWNGPSVNARFPEVLNTSPNRTQLTINSPVSIADTHVAGSANFGDPVPANGLTANVILANDSVANPNINDGCEPITNDLTGAIALVIRGDCDFVLKVLNAQNAGAIGVLIANNEDIGIVGMNGTEPGVTVPSLGISKKAGDDIISQLPGVSVTMGFTTTAFIGENGGHVRKFAPESFDGGSSVSHWSTTASPNLLMEPTITPTIFSEVDLTYNLFEDIGWDVAVDLIFEDGFE
ncbi:MAG: PA domain-containing protein [Marinicellaceae bacterium]